ncbi:MAG: hypothetical protein U9O20_02415 [Patescibacteria group bacterium]|nr:hypothetical protein [Patescibacteria group bacterium]
MSSQIIIDCDAGPFCPDGWKVVEHGKGGQLEWDASKIQLYLSKKQEGGSWIEGNKLREELADKSVLNANVLDYLLKNPHFIPEEWKSKYVFFLGTVYCRSGGYLVVRCLFWFGDEWGWSFRWLVHVFLALDPAILLAS